jgi:hypothetical protein
MVSLPTIVLFSGVTLHQLQYSSSLSPIISGGRGTEIVAIRSLGFAEHAAS